MPVSFWNDPDGARYRESYFDTWPGVWRHGDRTTKTSRNTFVIHGRSDATINRHGVRLGTADIYDVVQRLPEVAESLVVGVEQPDGRYYMPLFVVLTPGVELDPALRQKIADAIRENASPRAVPDEIIQARHPAHRHRQATRGTGETTAAGGVPGIGGESGCGRFGGSHDLVLRVRAIQGEDCLTMYCVAGDTVDRPHPPRSIAAPARQRTCTHDDRGPGDRRCLRGPLPGSACVTSATVRRRRSHLTGRRGARR
jgi:hypothetical protein